MKPYVIKQGDHLKKLAHTLGFNADEVWNDPSNAELRKLRQEGSILSPGDVLFIPDKPKPRHAYEAETTNRYVAELPKLEVRILLKLNNVVLPEERYIVEGLGDPYEEKADKDGYAVIKVPVHIREILVALPDRKVKYRVDIGGIDPVTLPSGQRMRLKNLGYYGATEAGEDRYEVHNEAQLKAALTAFQRDQKLPPTGEADEATQKALVKAHGS